VDEKTVRKARADKSAPDTVTGRDGKTYPAKKPAKFDPAAPDDNPEVVALNKRAEAIGWRFGRVILHLPDGKGFTKTSDFEFWKLIGVCHAGGAEDHWIVKTTLRDAPALLDDIEAHPEKYGPPVYVEPDESHPLREFKLACRQYLNRLSRKEFAAAISYANSFESEDCKVQDMLEGVMRRNDSADV
jgi:hypothetical protein